MKCSWLLSSIIFSTALCRGAAISPGVVNPANGHTYYLLETDTWAGSEAAAIALGGRLATINDAMENQWVFETFGNFGGQARLLWIGLNDAAQDGVFRWSSGYQLRDIYLNWAPGEPNDAGSEGYVAIYYPGHDAGGMWNDWGERTHDPIGLPFNGVVEVAPVGPPTPQDIYSLHNGLAAAFLFNGDLRDSSGNVNHATGFEVEFVPDRFAAATSAAIFWPSGWARSASSPSLDIHGDSGLTITAWINTANAVDPQTIASKWGPGGDEDDQFYLGLALGRVRFQTDEEITIITGQTRLEEARTYHVAGVYDPTLAQIAIYVNGRLDNAIPLLHPIRSTTEPLTIGNASFAPEVFQGMIDDLMIYRRGLSANEVDALYTLQTSATPAHLEFMPPGTLRIRGRVGFSYDIEKSLDLAAWNKIGETVRLVTGDDLVSVEVPDAAAFYRVRLVGAP